MDISSHAALPWLRRESSIRISVIGALTPSIRIMALAGTALAASWLAAALPVVFDKEVRIHNSQDPFLLSLYAFDDDKEQLTFELTAPPQHGSYQLTDGPSQQSHRVDSANIVYIPESGFTGTETIRFRVKDPAGGFSNTAYLNLTVVDPVPSPWVPPAGIPKPEFGIDESHRMYVGETYDYMGSPGPYHDAGNGPYTHYLDNTHPAATNTNNRFGTATKPRTSLPSWADVQPGAVIEIHGGPYLTGQTVVRASGTAEKPVFIRGVEPNPASGCTIQMSQNWLFQGHHVIMENLRFTGINGQTNAGIGVRPSADAEDFNNHHIAVRHCHVEGSMNAGNYSDSIGDDFAHNVVYYSNEVHGDFVCDGIERKVANEQSGIGISGRCNRFWAVDNEVHHFPEDCIGGGHGAQYTAHFYFIGRNHLHETGGEAVDVKEVEHVVISENTMYHFHGENVDTFGGHIVIHYGPKYFPKDAWVLFNTCYDSPNSSIGNSTTSNKFPVYIIGNTIRGIHNPSGSGWAYRVWAAPETYFVDNVIHDVDNAIQSRPGSGNPLHFHGNIISDVHPDGVYLQMGDSAHCNESSISNNLFNPNSNGVKFIWGNTPHSSLEAFQQATGKAEGSVQDDPAFVNPTMDDFRLSRGSPAISKGTEHPVYQLFEDRFGISIRRDKAGLSRPKGSGWDIGAYEYDNGSNQFPVLDPIGSKSTPMGHTLQFQINASDPDDDPLTFSASGG